MDLWCSVDSRLVFNYMWKYTYISNANCIHTIQTLTKLNLLLLIFLPVFIAFSFWLNVCNNAFYSSCNVHCGWKLELCNILKKFYAHSHLKNTFLVFHRMQGTIPEYTVVMSFWLVMRFYENLWFFFFGFLYKPLPHTTRNIYSKGVQVGLLSLL